MNCELKRMVFVIDDDEAVRDSTLTLLQSAAIHCRGFASARECLAANALEQASCVVLDLHMPGMSGLEFLERIKADGVQVPVVVFSARIEALSPPDAERFGVIARLQKPLDSEALLQIVEGLARSAHAQPGRCRIH